MLALILSIITLTITVLVTLLFLQPLGRLQVRQSAFSN